MLPTEIVHPLSRLCYVTNLPHSKFSLFGRKQSQIKQKQGSRGFWTTKGQPGSSRRTIQAEGTKARIGASSPKFGKEKENRESNVWLLLFSNSPRLGINPYLHSKSTYVTWQVSSLRCRLSITWVR